MEQQVFGFIVLFAVPGMMLLVALAGLTAQVRRLRSDDYSPAATFARLLYVFSVLASIVFGAILLIPGGDPWNILFAWVFVAPLVLVGMAATSIAAWWASREYD